MRGRGAARILSAPFPPSPGPRNAIPPPPENIGSRQHQCMLSFGGAVGAGSTPPLLALPSSESEESSALDCSFMRFGDRVAPGAHQKRLFLGDLGFLPWVSKDAEDEDESLIVVPTGMLFPKARLVKCRVFVRFLGIGRLKAQLAHSVFRHPMQCIRTLHCSQRSNITSLH